ncbi:dual E2 ubiquitin-conjugating enzyme/E3 ubiquitin-protein ligase BIRC6-like [Convolutriloba macropyga]|uniref:dual E2 ubiquitin-conjugating enzyme/E3 ubiquitin-protein ligase BIRC6-like n=1 Tax=Convolutriloba macropyga TaxID=536237 RepID=UPI003F528949
MDIDCPSVPPIDKNGWTTIEIGKSCEKIVYYPEVNALLCYHKSSDITSNDSKETSVNVLEITTGQILKTFHFASNIDHVMSLMKQKKVLIGTGNVLGLTREVSGCLYLDTCLQLPSSTGNQNCILELSYEEVKVLQPWFEAMQKSKELTESLRSSTDKVVTELREAMKQLPNDKQLSESASSHLTNIAKKLKWHSVKLCMTIDDFLEILEGIYAFRFTKEREEIFGDRGSNESTDYQLLPILFAVIDRLACLHASGRQLFLKLEELVSKEPNSDGSHDIGVGGFVPGMCSEYARRLTFITWPHYSYKWAKPDSMAKAGFYHTKGAHNGKDGVQCFKCRINLVKWEASDEPWNEHEQHSPNCLFLRGEPTHNVPIANTIAFSPAVRSSDEKAISVISNSNHPFFVASSSADGCINVWNCCAVPKLYFNFSIDASDEQIVNVFARYTDSPSASSKHKLYNKDGQEMKGIASMLPSFFMEEVSSDPTAPCPESSSGKGPKKSATSNDQEQRTLISLPDPDDDCVITCLSGADEAGGILINQKMETADNPTVTFPLEEEPTSSKMADCVQVTSLALSGFEGVNPSPLGCIVVVGCKVADPRSPLVSSTSASTATVDRETCLLVYKVDCSDLRATKTALFHQPPDHTNLLAMDDKYSNFASEIAASHPMHSTIDDMMMIGDLNEDGIHMEIELAHSPEMLDPADAPSAMVGDPLLYNDYTSYAQTATANVYESEMLATGSSDFSGVPNKLYNLLDAKLMQAMPLQAGSEITHIIMEQYGTQPFFYVIASKDSSSAVYVFLMEKIFNSFHLRPSMNNAQKQQNVIKMHCNQQFAQGVIKHALLLPLWSCNLGEYPLFVTTTTSSSDLSSVLLCVSDNDDIVLFKLPKLECVTLQTEADKNLFGGNKIKSVSFDCGSDSLCILTSDGKVHFVEMRKLLGEQDDKDSGLNAALNDVQEDEMDCGVTVGTSSAEGKFSKSTASNQIPASVSNTNAISIVRASGTGSGQQQQIKQLQHQSVNRFDYLADAKGKTPDLNTATLDWISQLSECVPLTPRFLTGLVPSGWVEVEQEQQQRKFSEHLPSSGGSVLHTRTFRVNKESSSCVTVLELQLPFAVVLGHVDVKIQLKKATNVHDLTATLSCPSEIAGGVVSRDTFSQTNRKLLGPVPLKLFRFGNQGLSINVSLTGPKLYLMKHRVLFLELGCKGTTSNSLNLHEVSITVRKMKKPPTARTIAQVQTVLEDTSLVEKLLAAVIEPERSVHTVGDTKEFFMSGPTVRQTALTSLTWLLYTHATDSGNSRDYLASFYSKCFNGNGGRMMRDLVQVCFIEGDRSLAHLFARFLAVLLKFLVTLQKQERQEFFYIFKQTLLDMLPKMVTCASHGGMHWFQLFFYQVVVADTHVSDGSANSIQSAFSICLDLLDHLVDCSESSQDTFTKTLQNKFRLFCNPFEQKILTFPMQTIIAHDSPKQGAGGGGYSGFGTNSFMNPLPAGGGKWYMSGGGPLGAGGSGSTTNYVQQLFGAGGPLPTGSESVDLRLFSGIVCRLFDFPIFL